MREEGAFELYDKFGQAVVEDVRDGALSLAANIVKGTTNNKVDLSYYECFSELSEEQKEKAIQELEKINNPLADALKAIKW